ncbi:MAG: O-antigen ligase family protein [Bacteroidetes bacterium]|nr:O-antigen ligase family protein [Bacteroidota bacterium]
MLSIIRKNRALFNKINFYLALIFAFCLPLYKDFLPYIIWLWSISWVLEGDFKNKFSNFNNKNILLLLLIFYIFHIVGLLYSKNLEVGFFDIQVKFSIFLFPILLCGSNYLYKKNYNKIFFSFIFGNIAASLICIGSASFRSISIVDNFFVFNSSFGWSNYFTYANLSIFQHPSYFAMYLAFATAILFYLFDYENKFSIIRYKIFYITTVFLFFVMIFLLSSRAGIISEFFVLFGSLFIYTIKYKKILNSSLFFIFLCFLFFFVLNNNVRVKKLENELLHTNHIAFFDSSKNSNKNIKFSNKQNTTKDSVSVNKIDSENPNKIKTEDKRNIRLQIWDVTYELIKEHFFTGAGAGDIKDELIACYEKENINEAKIKYFNVHNQFLETFLGQGLIGLIMLVLIILIPFYFSFRNRNYLLFFFILLISINFVFESMLNTISGVLFFAFFYSMLVFIEGDKKNLSNMDSSL